MAKKREQSWVPQNHYGPTNRAFAPTETGKRRRLNRHTEWNGEQPVQSQGRIVSRPFSAPFVVAETGKRRRIEWNVDQGTIFAPIKTDKRRRIEWNEEQSVQSQGRTDDQGIAFTPSETGKRRRLEWNEEKAVQNQRHTMSRPDQGIASFPSRTASIRSPSEKLTSADNGFGFRSPETSTQSPNDTSTSIGDGECGSSGDDSGTPNLEPIAGSPRHSYRRRGDGEYDSGVNSGATTPKPTTIPNALTAVSKNDDETWEPAEYDSGIDKPSGLGTEDTHKRQHVQTTARSTNKKGKQGRPFSGMKIKDSAARRQLNCVAERMKKLQKNTTWQDGANKPQFHVFMMVYDESEYIKEKIKGKGYVRFDDDGNESPRIGLLAPEGVDQLKFLSWLKTRVIEMENSLKGESNSGGDWAFETDPGNFYEYLYPGFERPK